MFRFVSTLSAFPPTAGGISSAVNWQAPMSDVVIQVESMSNLYRIGRAQQRHDTGQNCGMQNCLQTLRNAEWQNCGVSGNDG